MAVRVTLCGPLGIEIAGTAVADRLQGRKGPLAFAYLVLHRDRTVSRDELMGAIWSDDDRAPATPDAALSTILSRLRSAVAPTLLTGREQMTLDLGADCEVDWEIAHRTAAGATDALAAGRPAQAAAGAKRAAAILERPFLSGVGGHWVEERRREQQSLRVVALETLGRAALALGGPELGTAESAARALVDAEPYRESGYALLMEVHAARGNVAEALRVYHELREFLREELGVAPAPEVTALNARLLGGGPDAAAVTSVAGIPRRPHGPRVPASGSPFVGRAAELARLAAHLDATLDGAMRLVVLSGEPGIGKTRLVAQLMEAADERGARVLYGGGDADAVLSYQPVAEALRAYVPSAMGAMRADGLENELEELGRLLPELELGRSAPDLSTDPEVRRFRLFQSVAAAFAHAARDRPLLLVLDDLQWTDRSTRELLAHLVRGWEVPQSLVVAVHRQEGAAALVSAAQRYRVVDHVELAGLTEDESSRLVHAHLPDASQLLVRRLTAQTGGNPFFIEELLRSVREADSEAFEDVDIPPGIRLVVERRLERFGDEALKVLRAAAVAGHDFDLEILDRSLSVGTDVVLDAVEAALTAGILVEDGERPDRFAFSHALVRGTLYRTQSASRRMRLHLAVGNALEAAGHGHPAELGHHFWEARHVGGAGRAAVHLADAGRLADDALAWEDAARHYERALQVEAMTGERSGALLLALGDALEHSGDSEGAKRVFLEAATSARERGDGRLLGFAALGYGRAPGPAFGADPTLLGLLDEARAELADDDGTLRARVLGRLAVERASVDGAESEVDALSAEAVRLAEESGDDVVLAVALASRHWTLSGPEMLAERCDVARRSLDLAIRAGDRERELAGREWWLFDLAELGDIAGVEEQLARYDALAVSFRHPSYGGYSLAIHAMLALLRGEHARAAELIDDARELLGRALDPDADRVYALQRFVLHLQEGAPHYAAHALDAMTDLRPIWSCLRAWAWAEYGDAEQAGAVVPEPDRIPPDGEWLVSMTALAHTAAALGDTALADRVAAPLVRYADRTAAVGGIVCLGSIAYPAGRVLRMLSDGGESARLLRIALERNIEMGAAPAANRVRSELAAETSLRKGGP